jgi:O-antigen/teichoic acid export membrane protein
VRIIGQFALVSAPVVALWVLSTAKEQAGLIREITHLPPRHPRVTQLFAAVFTFSSCLTVVMSALAGVITTLVFRGPLHQPELVTPMLVSLAGYAVVTNTGWNIDAVLTAFVAGRKLFWVRLHETLSFLVIAIAIGSNWHSVWGLVIATIGGSLTALLHRTVVVRHFVRVRLNLKEYRLGLSALPGLLRFGLKITPGSIAFGLGQQVGVWAIASVSSVTAVGAYSRAQTIPERLQQVNMRIVEVLYPTLVGRRSKGDGEGFDRALVDSIRYALIGMLLIAAVCGGTSRSVLLIFGPGFSQAAPAFALLILCPALASIMTSQTQALYAVDRPGLSSVISLVRLAVIIVLTVFLTPALGIVGPALALIAGFVVYIVWTTIVLHPFLAQPLHVTWRPREGLALVASYGAGFAVARITENAVSPSLLGLLLSLISGVAAYVLSLFAFGGVNHRDRTRLVEAIAWARGWRGRRSATAPAQEAVEPAI